ncbi:MAG: NUDIX hydrolase [Deltaproteobacteria bacterium]|nr:NUDIX hydrolase [Deltaproteobacteria bacterium]MBW1962459.1 NUDIX hydrolase [Deltaproteobacteria bacterium]MBW2154139.1 NUDIX hydrolase [Deltaproteobacteria bacterium]
MNDRQLKSSAVYPDSPRVAVGAIVFRNEKVLLVQRGRPPAKGVWAIPGGSVNLGETLQQAAEREINEETGITIKAREPTFTFDVVVRDDSGAVRYHYVIVDLLADYIGGEPQPGDDALDVRWFKAEELRHIKLSEATRKLLKERFNFGLE